MNEEKRKQIPLTRKIYFFTNLLPTLTKDEADLIENVLKWGDEEKAAFLLAKKMFEEEDE